MAIEVIYMSKNTTIRHHTKLDFAVTYYFGHSTCISGPLLSEIGSKCAYLEGVSHEQLVQLTIFFHFQKHATTTAGLVLFFSPIWTDRQPQLVAY